MSNPIAKNEPRIQDRILELLQNRRNYRNEIKALVEGYPYVVFYGCGIIFDSICDRWNEYIDRKIDFCCDRDSTKWGKYFSGIRCISLQEFSKLKDRCAVFVTVGDFKPVFEYLVSDGFASVNMIYKYDLANSDYLACHNLQETASNLFQTREMLSDEQSVRVFDAVLERVLGSGKDINLMANICEKDQYFPPGVVNLSGHESFVDVGAFDGDTIKDFLTRTDGRFDGIFSFELNETNFRRLEDNIRQMNGAESIKLFNLGAWDSECEITYSFDKSDSTIGEGENKGRVVPLDDVLRGERVTFIKMDIEGAEPNALRGARNIIATQKPKLAICVYHHISHLWEVPLYLKSLVPEYKFFLRHHTTMDYETVCYAIPPV